MILLKNCSVIPELVEGFQGTKCDVVLDGQRIKEICGCGAFKASADETIDLAGKYLLPGFFDLHVHLGASAADPVIDLYRSPVQAAYDAVKFAQDTLKAGFTSVRDVGSPFNIAVDLRDAVNCGKIMGPTIWASARIITPTENGNAYFGDMYNEADGPDEIWKAVRQEMQHGADFIKIMGTGAVMNPGGDPGQPICTYEELCAAVEAAKFKDTYVASHCHGTRGIKESVRAGVRTLEHASFMDDEAVEMLAGSENTFLVPTLSIDFAMIRDIPETAVFIRDKAKRLMEAVQTGIRKSYDAGLRLGFGTDCGGVPLPHGANGEEFLHRKSFWDMKEIDIIKQATIDSAHIIGVEKDYGTVKAGKYADLVIVDGNPLQDISVLRDHIDTVFKWGKVFP